MLAAYEHICGTEHQPPNPGVIHQLRSFSGALVLQGLSYKECRPILKTLLMYSSQLQQLLLSRLDLSSLGSTLASCLTYANNLQGLSFADCHFGPQELVHCVFETIVETSLTSLSITGCKLTDRDLISFSHILNQLPAITSLSFAHNAIKERSLKALLDALDGRALTTLDLRSCNLGSTSGQYILEYLKRYPGSLQSLLVTNNNFNAELSAQIQQQVEKGKRYVALAKLEESLCSSLHSIDSQPESDGLHPISYPHLGGSLMQSGLLDEKPTKLGKLTSQADMPSELRKYLDMLFGTATATFVFDPETFKWDYSIELVACQKIIMECQAAGRPLGLSDLSAFLERLQQIQKGIHIYNSVLRWDAEQRSLAKRALEAELQGLYGEINEKNVSIISLEERTEQLREQIVDSNKELQLLQQKTHEVTPEENLAFADLEKVEQRLNSMREKCEEATKEVTLLKEHLHTAQKRLDEQRGQIHDKSLAMYSHLPRLLQARAGYQGHLDRLLTRTSGEVERLTAELAGLME
ncbi:hypothetical protein GMRT_10987 [Giardia muris]|uniref:Leucine-rich repeat protein n=1 Tax=Giardia muris TaxID=5742 RepID=A0A4Z1STU5_GIAMU|nr:hypothetical protein GMRT_10987 [Giardia muris]|eukprot:TNJ29326.1 hypothetical protein GMRT_10987 [Giardia muris]